MQLCTNIVNNSLYKSDFSFSIAFHNRAINSFLIGFLAKRVSVF